MTQQEHTDELDLRRLLQTIWQTRSWVSAILIVFSLLFWVIVAIQTISIPSRYQYTQQLELVFPGIEDGEYPNGAEFSINEIIAPNILSKVYQKFALNQYGLAESDFMNSFSIIRDAPTYAAIINKYETLLKTERLNFAEISKIQDDLDNETDKALSGSVKLIFALNEFNALDPDLMRQVFTEVPKTWAEHSKSEYGAMNIKRFLFTNKILDQLPLTDLEPLIAYDLLMDKVHLIDTNINTLLEQPNAYAVKDSQTGYTAADLSEWLNQVKVFRIEKNGLPLRYQPTLNKKSDPIYAHFRNKINRLKQQQMTQQKKAEVIIDILVAYTTDQPSTYKQQANQDLAQKQRLTTDLLTESGNGNPMILSIRDNFIDDIIRMHKTNDQVEFKQELAERIEIIYGKAIEYDQQIGRIQDVLADLDSNLADSSGQLALDQAKYQQIWKQQLPIIIKELSAILGAIESIDQSLSDKYLTSIGDLYRYTSDIDFSKTNSIQSLDYVLLYVKLLFVMLVLAIPMVMATQVLRSKQ